MFKQSYIGVGGFGLNETAHDHRKLAQKSGLQVSAEKAQMKLNKRGFVTDAAPGLRFNANLSRMRDARMINSLEKTVGDGEKMYVETLAKLGAADMKRAQARAVVDEANINHIKTQNTFGSLQIGQQKLEAGFARSLFNPMLDHARRELTRFEVLSDQTTLRGPATAIAQGINQQLVRTDDEPIRAAIAPGRPVRALEQRLDEYERDFTTQLTNSYTTSVQQGLPMLQRDA